MNEDQRILVFTRYPQAGKVKTRLIPALGAKGAARLHARLTEELIQRLKPFCELGRVFVYFCGASEQAMQEWLGEQLPYFEQQGEGLGQRMLNALRHSWQQGATQTLLIGSDCPALDIEIITNAFKVLSTHDLVLGPAVDGGYYLIGLKALCPGHEVLFQNIAWGTDQVLQQSLAQAAQEGLSWLLLPPLHDLDRPEDLAHFHYHSSSQ